MSRGRRKRTIACTLPVNTMGLVDFDDRNSNPVSREEEYRYRNTFLSEQLIDTNRELIPVWYSKDGFATSSFPRSFCTLSSHSSSSTILTDSVDPTSSILSKSTEDANSSVTQCRDTGSPPRKRSPGSYVASHWEPRCSDTEDLFGLNINEFTASRISDGIDFIKTCRSPSPCYEE